MRKGRDGGKKTGGEKKENTDENNGHYVIASSRPPERRPLECRTLAPIWLMIIIKYLVLQDYKCLGGVDHVMG